MDKRLSVNELPNYLKQEMAEYCRMIGMGEDEPYFDADGITMLSDPNISNDFTNTCRLLLSWIKNPDLEKFKPDPIGHIYKELTKNH